MNRREARAKQWSFNASADGLMDVEIEGEHSGVPATGRTLFVDALPRRAHALSGDQTGTTRRMYPHPSQMEQTDENHGTSNTWLKPLQRKIGDDAANVASLLDTSTSNTMKLLSGTDANDYVYSLSLGGMLDARGEVVPKQRLVGLASKAGKALQTYIKAAGGLGTEAVIGSVTVARAISAQSRIRQVQGRSSLLGDVAERLSRASLGG
ncbi:MAG: hypothetical protein R3F04_05770 [Lysobacteraceae bacterium]